MHKRIQFIKLVIGIQLDLYYPAEVFVILIHKMEIYRESIEVKSYRN